LVNATHNDVGERKGGQEEGGARLTGLHSRYREWGLQVPVSAIRGVKSLVFFRKGSRAEGREYLACS